MSQDEQSQQLVELQTQVAFQDEALQSLNDALAVQQREILLLQRQLELLKQRQDEQVAPGNESGADSSGQEKPPHY